VSDPRFLQDGFDKQLAHLVEECGEVLAAAGKTQRWGLDSVNPLLPVDQQETNGEWLFREIVDLDEAIGRLLATMRRARSPTPTQPHQGRGDVT
jgi:NTP pyrophosphatase (non-canonical NTP hydrolase)